jgi:hypothetical protein
MVTLIRDLMRIVEWAQPHSGVAHQTCGHHQFQDHSHSHADRLTQPMDIFLYKQSFSRLQQFFSHHTANWKQTVYQSQLQE